MESNHINLFNSNIRIAFQKGDADFLFKSTLTLFNGDKVKTEKLLDWFSNVANQCREKLPINDQIVKMRMWQLGNMDILKLDSEGKPVLAFTSLGLERVINTSKANWCKSLLCSSRNK